MIFIDDNYNLKNNIERLLRLDDYVFAQYILSKDYLYAKIDEIQINTLIKESVKCAEGEFKKIKYYEDFGDICDIANKNNIKILYSNDIDEYFPCFSLFNEKRNTIYIFNKTIKTVEEVITKNNLNLIFGDVKLENIAFYHEFFHFIESKNSDIYTRKKNIVVSGILKYKYKLRSIGVSEVAAVHFSKLMSGISFSPVLYELLLLYYIKGINILDILEFALNKKGSF
ncbi:uncharacterized protein Thert_00837 [Thermoanaerobacterium thermosaccharolyticum]|uniref:Uncharacterized protein n=1 Tax=Thermoanaerobacterium thermosaccharolyticum TaxID=1517 RepID=A0A223HWW4_THETR|nr:uncharacterized protein Thert_00837 [Thermoanaerobacterium thermosaccharolyticum]